MKVLLAVAAGGAVGALARYAMVSRIGHWLGPNYLGGFPVAVLAANVLGSLLLGVLIEATALAWSPSEALRAFLVVGALGAFTTFSTFAMEAVLLGERHALGAAALYVAASVGLSVGGLVAGMRGVKWLLT